MTFTRTVSTTKSTIKNTHRYRNGGFFTYLKLTFQLWGQAFAMPSEGKYKLYIIMLLKTPYWLLIKPWLCFFSSVVVYKGSYTSTNNIVDSKKHTLIKSIIFRYISLSKLYHQNRKIYNRRIPKISYRVESPHVS